MAELDLMTLQSALAQQQFAPGARAGGAQLGPFGLPEVSGDAPKPKPGGGDDHGDPRPRERRRKRPFEVFGIRTTPKAWKAFEKSLVKSAVGSNATVNAPADAPGYISIYDLPKDHVFRKAAEEAAAKNGVRVHGIDLAALDEDAYKFGSRLLLPAIRAKHARASATMTPEQAEQAAAALAGLEQDIMQQQMADVKAAEDAIYWKERARAKTR